MALLIAKTRRQLRQPRLAELVAEALRLRITSGQLQDGDRLPKLEELIEEFQVSKPSLREALRILETEGLITVRRGNVGGAVVHAPGSHDAGYMIGLVLESREVRLDDLASALRQIEPVCAALCAARPDRATAVVPRLRAIVERTLAVLPDQLGFTVAGREFHEAVVSLCGNETMKLVVGALEALWSAHEQDWARRATGDASFPEDSTRLEGARAHTRLVDLIEQGDVAGVSRAARKHLETAQLYAGSDTNEVIRAAAVRGGQQR